MATPTRFPERPGPPREALEAELIALRRIAARANDPDGLKAVIVACGDAGATTLARRLRNHLMAP